jgi:hypothetical protein
MSNPSEAPTPEVRVVVIDSNELRRDWRARLTRPVVGWVLAALGALFILLGYLGVAHEALVAKQIPYLVSGGIGGMVLVAVGAFLLGTDDVRKQLEKVEKLEVMVGDLHKTLLVPAGTQANDSGLLTDDTASFATAAVDHSGNGTGSYGGRELVALPRGKSFHVAGCSMVAGKQTQTVDLSAIRTRGLRPCPLCSPDPVALAN